MRELLYFLKQILFPNWKQVEEDDFETEREPSRWALMLAFLAKKLRTIESAGIFASLLIHLFILIILSWLFLPIQKPWNGIDLLGGFSLPKIETKDISLDLGTPDQSDDKPQETDAAPHPESEEIASKVTDPTQTSDVQADPAAVQDKPTDQTENAVGSAPSRKMGEFVSGGGYESRNPQGRGRALGTGDCSSQGENAVEAALQWLAAHQTKTGPYAGSWTFQLSECCPAGLECSHSGTYKSRKAATALALLPFLGAGYTHETGPYKKTVEDGLYFLLVHAAEGQRGADLCEGLEGMYTHGIASMALCEAYAMSKKKPKRLTHIAQETIRFIENAQNRDDGGWRYKPNQPGDLSVTAWQVMALKSAKLAELHVPLPTIYAANDFLDSVAMYGGIQYNYVPYFEKRGRGKHSPKTCDATGLLLRMYLGWQPGDKMLDEGIEMIAKKSPILHDGGETGKEDYCCLFYTYYATLALHHYGGSYWPKWNNEVREYLIRTQAKDGHEAGSWFFPDYYADKGGRLLNTVLATLVLETPYRIMPLFR